MRIAATSDCEYFSIAHVQTDGYRQMMRILLGTDSGFLVVSTQHDETVFAMLSDRLIHCWRNCSSMRSGRNGIH